MVLWLATRTKRKETYTEHGRTSDGESNAARSNAWIRIEKKDLDCMVRVDYREKTTGLFLDFAFVDFCTLPIGCVEVWTDTYRERRGARAKDWLGAGGRKQFLED
jgi:hypothetical protein